MAILGLEWSEHKKLLRGELRPTYLPLFIGERDYMCGNMILTFFMHFCNQNGKFRFSHFGDPQIKKSKNSNFQNVLKYDLNEF